MARNSSDQFVEIMYHKTHPRRKQLNIEDMPQADIDEIAAIVDRKGAIDIGPAEQDYGVTVNSRVLANILTSAMKTARTEQQKMLEQSVRSLLTIDKTDIDAESLADWKENFKYWDDQVNAIELIEKQVVETLRDQTHEEDFYLK